MTVFFIGEQHGASWLTHGSYLCFCNPNFEFVKDSNCQQFLQDVLSGIIRPSAIVVTAFVPEPFKQAPILDALRSLNIPIGWMIVDKFSAYAYYITQIDYTDNNTALIYLVLDSVFNPYFYIVNNKTMQNDFSRFDRTSIVFYTPGSRRIVAPLSYHRCLESVSITYDGSLSQENLLKSSVKYDLKNALDSNNLSLDIRPWNKYLPTSATRALFNLRGEEANNAASYVHRWKPSSKLGVAASMGVPYVSEEESGLNELAEIYPILFYKCEQSLKHCLDVIANNSSFCQLLQKCQNLSKDWIIGDFSYQSRSKQLENDINSFVNSRHEL